MSVNLTKGQKISLEKEAGGALSKVVMGLGWDAKKKGGMLGALFGGTQEIDLDASCVLFDEAGNMVDSVWFRQLKSKDGSIVHTGDNRTGAGEGDDEQIIVDLPKVPANIKSLVFVVNSFTGQNFSQIENAFCRMVDQASNREIAKYDLSCSGNHTAQIMAKVYRHGGEWKMHAIGENASGKTFHDLLPVMKAHL
ncbi:MAG TPA: TerD family protein [Chroococcales cyanobacterium]